MRNRTPPRPKGHVIPTFTPVPRKCKRHDGWTPERQRGFIEALARTGSVDHASKAVNMASEGAYQLRLAPGAESFREAWTAALDFGVQMLEDIAFERAINGVLEPVFGRDGQIGERRRYNDRLLIFLLRHRLSERYAAQKDELWTPEREAELRTQWEEEQRKTNDGSRTLEELKRKLLAMKQRGEEQKALGLVKENEEDSPRVEEDNQSQEPDSGARIRTF